MMGGYGFGTMGFLGPIIQIGLIILVVYFVFSLIKKPTSDRGLQNDALEILKNRYAKGELSEEEYERMKKKIQ